MPFNFVVPQSLVGSVGEVSRRVRVEKQGAYHPLSWELSQCGIPHDQVCTFVVLTQVLIFIMNIFIYCLLFGLCCLTWIPMNKSWSRKLSEDRDVVEKHKDVVVSTVGSLLAHMAVFVVFKVGHHHCKANLGPVFRIRDPSGSVIFSRIRVCLKNNGSGE